MEKMCFFMWGLLIGLISMACHIKALGVNWGTQATHMLPPETVVQMLKDNGIGKVKLFDADEKTLSALAGSGIEVMVAIPNNQLRDMTDYDRAQEWVKENVTRYNFKGGVNIKYVAVGNEPFLTSYKGSFLNLTFPALENIQNALNDAGLGSSVRATVPLNADVYSYPDDSGMPSKGRFRPDIIDQMKEIIQFLDKNGAPFTVNIYPFLSLYQDSNFPLDFAFFDGPAKPVVDNGTSYTNVFDANFDTLVSALKAVGYGNMTILVGEVGWPTDGNQFATKILASRFYKGLLSRLASKTGTPLRPGFIEVYLFGLMDEDAKSVAPGDFERHWGIFRYDGVPKFPMDLSDQDQNKMLVGAKDVNYLPQKWCMLDPDAKDKSKLDDSIMYACTHSDCTALGYGSSCNGLDANGNASYAFNMYFQTQDQDESACGFQGLGKITSQNISQGNCSFVIQLKTSSSSFTRPSLMALLFLLAFKILL